MDFFWRRDGRIVFVVVVTACSDGGRKKREDLPSRRERRSWTKNELKGRLRSAAPPAGLWLIFLQGKRREAQLKSLGFFLFPLHLVDSWHWRWHAISHRLHARTHPSTHANWLTDSAGVPSQFSSDETLFITSSSMRPQTSDVSLMMFLCRIFMCTTSASDGSWLSLAAPLPCGALCVYKRSF